MSPAAEGAARGHESDRLEFAKLTGRVKNVDLKRNAWRRTVYTATMFFAGILLPLLFLFHATSAIGARSGGPLTAGHTLGGEAFEVAADTGGTYSYDVSACPGYTLTSLTETPYGLTARLNLAGPACNAFGQDIADLTIEVTYETQTRLHVNIYDTAQEQFAIPQSVISVPSSTSSSSKDSSDLVFNYSPSPFSFWITRASAPSAPPLFDTRPAALPPAPAAPFNASDARTGYSSFGLVFEDQYVQLSSALPYDANVYGLGETVASAGLRRDVGAGASGGGTVQTMWARDAADPIDENVYGSHPIYLEHRYDESTGEAASHGVFLFSSAGTDILLSSPTPSTSVIQYRAIGGTLNLYFFSGPTPARVIEQYGEVVGLPAWVPDWGFGFHLCRWGYTNLSETAEQVANMRAAGIPLETMWNDIDIYHAYRDFTTDPARFPTEDMRAFIQNLTANHQHYIPILDAAVPITVNATDVYDPYTSGLEQDVFVKNPDGSEYIGQVWPGYTVFADWFANATEGWWTQALLNWSTTGGVEFSGLWLDMNEISSFCTGSCGTNADTSIPFSGAPASPITVYPECYNSTIFGPSGNMTVNGTSTYHCGDDASDDGLVDRDQLHDAELNIQSRGQGAGGETGVDVNNPPYAIHNGNGDLSVSTLATNATHAPGYLEYDVHNMWGLMEEKASNLAFRAIRPGKRPFLISRSTFPSSGKWTGHWLGDNYSKWQYMMFNIQGVLQFQIFQIPLVGADTCGFNDNTDEELCNRWMQLSAFMPFYRNHNTLGAISQEPYRWPSVANASITAISIRYSLLPYWYSLFANASTYGTPPVRALFWEFPTEPELFSIDTQWLIGSSILVTPVLQPNVTSVEGIFPGRGSVIWRDWYTHAVVDTNPGQNTTLDAPLGHINVHIRDSSVLLLHAAPAYTIYETRLGPYSLLVSLNGDGYASSSAYVDDGESLPPGPNKTLSFYAKDAALSISSSGEFDITQKLDNITIVGVASQPSQVSLSGGLSDEKRVVRRQLEPSSDPQWDYNSEIGELVITGADIDLNRETMVTWS